MRFVLSCLLLLSTVASARWVPFEAFRFQPVDEAERDSGFLAFRDKFLRAVETHDREGLLALVSDRVTMSVLDRTKTGKAAFVAEWNLEKPRDRNSPVWDKLRAALRLGGSFDGGEFRSPYVFSRWPSRFPHLDFYAVTTKRAPVYAQADENSRVLAILTQEIVGRFDEVPNPPGWRAVRTHDGTTGYLRSDDLRSPVDYRAIFRREPAGWRLALFASGVWEAHERPE